jgi:hypothetical protein
MSPTATTTKRITSRIVCRMPIVDTNQILGKLSVESRPRAYNRPGNGGHGSIALAAEFFDAYGRLCPVPSESAGRP